uniref:Uncharacterized protein n=1 Tax=Gopherus evgoodei TaxID=1825980 RepID=A0A8C4YJU1_9SAUR
MFPAYKNILVTLSQKRYRGPPNAPVTWGQIKSLSQQADHLLKQQDKEKSPENFLLALIACLNAKFCVMLCIMPWPPPWLTYLA